MKIVNIIGREIYDSAGLPTLSCEIELEGGIFVVASVPSGTSIGEYEAYELRDGGRRLFGYGVEKAIEIIEKIIAPVLIGKIPDVLQADQLIMQLDGTPDKSYLGANTILAVSIAVARAQALIEGIEVFELMAHLTGTNSVTIPFPFVNIFSGGRHAENSLFFQEFMVVPIGAESFRDALEIIVSINAEVEKIMKNNSINYSISSEGAFVPFIETETEALDIISQAIEHRGRNSCVIALDVAASEFYNKENNIYQLHDKKLSSDDMIALYKNLIDSYPIYSIEDGLDQNDFSGWALFAKQLADKVQIVGDDIFATNIDRIQQGLEIGIANAVVIKPNQVGTVTQTLDAIMLAKNFGMNRIASHRSRETSDTFIVDLAVGTSVGQIKLGGFRGDRITKYNRLLMIEDLLTSQQDDD